MDQLVGRFPYKVEPFSEDFTGRLSWFFLGNHLLRCASQDAGTHGFGFDDVMASHRAWVLSRLVVELDEMPRSGEAYTIETWVSKIYRQFTDRLFDIVGDGGKVYGHAFSIWALIDFDSREPIDFASLGNEAFTDAVVDRTIPIAGPGRIRVKSKDPVRQVTACYSDLDINGHVNSIRYLQMVLDLFNEEIYRQRQAIKRVEMAYCAESYCGEPLFFYREDAEAGRHNVEIRRENGEVLVKAAIVLQ